MALDLINRIKKKFIDYGFYKTKKGLLCIATYHGVDLTEEKKFNPRFFSKTNLEKHLVFYKKHFNSVSLKDIENQNFKKDRINIHVTFDDGYLNNYKYAFPLLENYNIHSTFYVTGIHTTENKILWPDLLDISKYFLNEDFIVNGRTYCVTNYHEINFLRNEIKQDNKGGGQFKNSIENQILKSLKVDFRSDIKLENYWKLMNDNEIRETSKSKYVGIGSHGFYHNNLGNLTLNDSVNEVLDSKNMLENITQKEISSIAFPDGSYTNKLLIELSKKGFKTQFLLGALDNEYLKINGVYDREGLYPIASSDNEIYYKLINGKSNRAIK